MGELRDAYKIFGRKPSGYLGLVETKDWTGLMSQDGVQ